MAAQGTHERRAAANQPRRAFAIREHPDRDGMLRLTLLGYLDLTTAETFRSRLAELKPSGRPVRLDLSQLAFIDSSGIQALLAVLTDARWTGWQLDVAQPVSPIAAAPRSGGQLPPQHPLRSTNLTRPRTCREPEHQSRRTAPATCFRRAGVG